MRKTTLFLCLLGLFVLCSFSAAAENPILPAPAKVVVVDGDLARQCLARAREGSEAGYSFIVECLRGLDRQDVERLAGLVREELGGQAAHAAAEIPPKGDLRAAWLLNLLHAESETLAFDLAEDGFFIQRIGPGKRYRFRTFGNEVLVVRMDDATLAACKGCERDMKGASRLFLRKMPSGGEYYAVAWRWLIKARAAPPAPNPDGRHVPYLMNQHPPHVRSPR